MRNTYLWQPWPRLRWPATAQEEAAFVEALRHDATSAKVPRKAHRGDITLVMDALRCALSYEELRDFAVGAPPARLLRAYEIVARELTSATAAWLAIEADPTVHIIIEQAPSAARLLPTPVSYLLNAINDAADVETLHELVRRTSISLKRVHVEAAELETQLASATTRRVAAEIGLQLYNPMEPSLWEHPFFMPTRVGSITPTRIADLIGERHGDVDRPTDVIHEADPPRRRDASV
jgi:hypothetical protein